MIPPDHMELPALKRLALRLIALPIFGTITPDTVESDLFEQFCRVAPDDPKLISGSLSDFLKAQLAAARARMPPPGSPGGSQAKALADTLEKAIGQDLCRSCANATKHVCNGSDASRDAQQVDEEGLCISVVHEVFEYLKSAIEAILRAWVLPEHRLSELDIRLSTLWSGDPGRDKPDSDEVWGVGGSLLYRDIQTAPRWLSDVRLHFQPKFLTWSSVLCIPWVLTHELVCHAYFGYGNRLLERDGLLVRDCPFNEGWMDELAHQILVADLTGLLRATRQKRGDLLRNFVRDIVDAATQFRGWRYGDTPGSSPATFAGRWRLGKKTARDVRDFFAQCVGNANPQKRDQWALRHLARLSYRIQQHGPLGTPAHTMVSQIGTLAAVAKYADRDSPLARDVSRLLNSNIVKFDPWLKDLKHLATQIERSVI